MLMWSDELKESEIVRYTIEKRKWETKSEKKRSVIRIEKH